jgi:hypothetical protein
LAAFLSELKTSFRRLPGEVPRFLLFESAGTSNAMLDCVGRRLGLSPVADSDPLTLKFDSVSTCELSGFEASTDAVLINGEDEV